MARNATVEPGPNDHVVDLYDGDELKDVRYGRWRDAKDGRYLLPAYLSGSDYSGSLVEQANHRKFSEEFSDGEDEWWTNTPGGHGTFGILIDMRGVPDDISTDVAEFLNGLQDYPLADEELHSEMEMEAQNEAWESWAKNDFKRGLERRFDVDLDGVDDEKLFELFREACDRSNTYWENQQGDEMYIDMERVLKKTGRPDIERYFGDVPVGS